MAFSVYAGVWGDVCQISIRNKFVICHISYKGLGVTRIVEDSTFNLTVESSQNSFPNANVEHCVFSHVAVFLQAKQEKIPKSNSSASWKKVNFGFHSGHPYFSLNFLFFAQKV